MSQKRSVEARRIEERIEELRVEELRIEEGENAAAEYLASWLNNTVKNVHGTGLLTRVTAALVADGKPPHEWVSELEALDRDGLLQQFVASCMASVPRANAMTKSQDELVESALVTPPEFAPGMRPGSPSSQTVFDKPIVSTTSKWDNQAPASSLTDCV